MHAFTLFSWRFSSFAVSIGLLRGNMIVSSYFRPSTFGCLHEARDIYIECRDNLLAFKIHEASISSPTSPQHPHRPPDHIHQSIHSHPTTKVMTNPPEPSSPQNPSLAALFLHLPRELQLAILLHLDKKAVSSLRQTSRAFYNITQIHQAPLVRHLIETYELCADHHTGVSSIFPGPMGFASYNRLHGRETLLRKLAGLMADRVEMQILIRARARWQGKMTPRGARVEYFHVILRHVLDVFENYREDAGPEISDDGEPRGIYLAHRLSTSCALEIVVLLWYLERAVCQRLWARAGEGSFMQAAKIHGLAELERAALSLASGLDGEKLAKLRDQAPVPTACSTSVPRSSSCLLSHAPREVTKEMVEYFICDQIREEALIQTRGKALPEFHLRLGGGRLSALVANWILK